MKGNDQVLGRVLLIACVFAIFSLLLTNLYAFRAERFPWDLDLRYNEICCMHEGVNPFDIWNRTVQSDRYVGYPRDDQPAIDSNGRRRVHAYPPWHATFFWWYGWVSKTFCVMLNSFAFSGIAVFMVLWLKRRYPKSDESLFWGIVLLPLMEPLVHCFTTMNYGVLEMGLLLAFATLYERRHDILLGIVWALMMIKPQFAILLFWTLLFGRRWKSIFVASFILVLATLPPAFVLGVSPMELILEIPEIGAPYVLQENAILAVVSNVIGVKMARLASLFGWAVVVCMAGAFSWALRKADTLTLLLPMSVFMYVRPYGHANDLLATWPLWLVLAALLTEPSDEFRRSAGYRWLKAFLVCQVAHWSFVFVWSLASLYISFSGLGWIYRGEAMVFSLLVFLAGVYTIIQHTRTLPAKRAFMIQS